MARRILFLLAAASFFTALFVMTGREAAVECEVCLAFDGRSACRTASAGDRESAQRGATTAACAVLAGGVTRGMECNRTPPRSLRCSD